MPDEIKEGQEPVNDDAWLTQVLEQQPSQEELEAQAAQVDGDPEPEPTGDPEPEPEPAKDPEPEPEEDEDLKELPQGKPITQDVLRKILNSKKAKYEGRLSEATAKAKAFEDKIAALEKSVSLDPQKLAQFQRLEQIFGNLDKAAAANPILSKLLVEIGEGKTADLQAFNKALGEHLQTQPRDPWIAAQLQEIKARQEAFEVSQTQTELGSRVGRENEELSKLFGGDQSAIDYVNKIALASVPGDIKSLNQLPNRVEIAKQLLGWSDKRLQAELKKRLPTPAAAKAGIGVKPGADPKPGKSKQEMPPWNSPAFAKWAAGLPYEESDL